MKIRYADLGVDMEFAYLGRTLRKKSPWVALGSHGRKWFMCPGICAGRSPTW